MAIKVTHIKPEFVDERGFISRIIDQDKFPVRAFLYITSKKGTERANHYHKKDAHFVYCLSGKFKYSEKNMKIKNSRLESVILNPGDLVLSEPMYAHSMEFLEDTIFLALTTENRSQEVYEEDTIRINLREIKNLQKREAPKSQKLNYCRMCKNNKLKEVISLGKTPPANSFLPKKNLQTEEDWFPLKVNYCKKCGQLQLSHVVSPDILFRDYVYVSSTSPVFRAHFEDYAIDIYQKFKLNKSSLVIDIGSNDGILLKPFKKLGTKVLGVDPATEIARQASKEGVETLPEYFDQNLAKAILEKYGPADVITGNNVFAHVHDLDELVKAVLTLLKKEGIFVIEFPYLVNFIKQNLFDTIYHEHLSYLSLRPLKVLFERFNMEIFDAIETPSHGGSLRVFVKRKGSGHRVKDSVKNLIKEEAALGLINVATYLRFAKKIEANKKKLKTLLASLKKQGKTIAGYGAPAKGNTLLNFFKITPDTLKYIVDDSPYKQGLFTPGTHIPVLSPETLNTDTPDYIFILAWNFSDSIIKKLGNFKRGGGSFIIPVPEPKIL